MFLGRLWGVGIYVNPFFLLLLGLFFVAGVLVKGLIAFGIVLVHELAHCLTARRLGIPADEVELLPFGGVTRMGSELVREPDREMLVAVAGPASNLVLTMLGIAAKNYGFWHHELGPFFLQCNLLIAAFNILPALPLDGGRVYRAYLARRLGVARATRRAARMGQWWGALVCLAGAAGVILGYSGLDIPVTGLFLFYAATRELTAAPYVYVLQLESKRERFVKSGFLPCRGLAVMEHAPLGRVVRQFLPEQYNIVLVFDRGGSLLGTLGEDKLLKQFWAGELDKAVGSLLE